MKDFWERTSFLGRGGTNSFKLKTKQRCNRRHIRRGEEERGEEGRKEERRGGKRRGGEEGGEEGRKEEMRGGRRRDGMLFWTLVSIYLSMCVCDQ